jgi:HEAT repeat protein
LSVVRAALLASLVCVVPACSSAKLTDLDPEQPDIEVRRDSLRKLGEQAHEDADLRAPLAEKVKRLVIDEDVSVRLVALRVLGKLAEDGVTPHDIAQILAGRAHDDKDFWCRIEAIVDLSELARLKDQQAIRDAARTDAEDACKHGVQPDEPDRDVRIHAARELSLLADQVLASERPERALPELIQALSDETPDVRLHANRALIAIAGADHGPGKEDWERWLKNREPGAPK